MSLLTILAALLLASSGFCFGYSSGFRRGRRRGYIHGHEHALASASRAIEDGVFRLAERVVEDCGGRHSPTLHRFLVAFTNGEHLKS